MNMRAHTHTHTHTHTQSLYNNSILLTDQDKDSGDSSVNVTVQDDGQTWDDIKVMFFLNMSLIVHV